MIPVFIDFETYFTPQISLRKMSLRRYLAATHVTAMAWKVGVRGTPCVVTDTAAMRQILESLRQAGCVFVAHNTAFDARVAKYLLGVDWFKHEICTLDLAQRAYPSWPGGYSLKNLADTLPGIPKKREIDLTPGKHTAQELADYCAGDVESCAALYQLCMAKCGSTELRIQLATARTRRLSLAIDSAKGAQAVEAFAAVVQANCQAAATALGLEDPQELAAVFGMDGAKIKSIKPAALKSALFESFGFSTPTISQKKINPEKLRRDPAAAAVLEATTRAGASLSHVRRVTPLLVDTEVDVNLSAFGSHTGRWTSKTTGKGVNFLNLPKHDPSVAKPIRSMLSVPGRVLVRGDLASLEYRMVGAWCRCHHTESLYAADVFADAYCAFGEAATGIPVQKKDPARQVWKQSVLGLGFLMSVRTHALNLARLLASAAAQSKSTGKPPTLTIDDFVTIVKAQRWGVPSTPYFARIRKELNLPEPVLAVAHHTHGLFHEIHPEIRRTADWFEMVLRAIAGASDPARVLAHHLSDRRRPPMVGFHLDRTELGLTLKLTCGPWPEHTLVWRDIGVRADAFGQIGLCSVTSKRGYRQLTPNIIVENITQAMGRNAVATGLNSLEDQGYDQILNVHDEVLIPVAPTVAEVLRARDAMARTFAPGGIVAQQFGWAAVMAPKELNVSRSLYESEYPDLWSRLEAGDVKMLDDIT
jgi:hypothetical protein